MLDADCLHTVVLTPLIFLCPEMQPLRVALASVGISCVAAAVTSYCVHCDELMPTLLKYKTFYISGSLVKV